MTALMEESPSDDFDVTEGDSYTINLFAPYSAWYRKGACAELDPEFFFTHSLESTAVVICNSSCSVKLQCRIYALLEGIPFGVWGGLTEKERKKFSQRGLVALRQAAKEASHHSYAELLLLPPVLRVVR